MLVVFSFTSRMPLMKLVIALVDNGFVNQSDLFLVSDTTSAGSTYHLVQCSQVVSHSASVRVPWEQVRPVLLATEGLGDTAFGVDEFVCSECRQVLGDAFADLRFQRPMFNVGTFLDAFVSSVGPPVALCVVDALSLEWLLQRKDVWLQDSMVASRSLARGVLVDAQQMLTEEDSVLARPVLERVVAAAGEVAGSFLSRTSVAARKAKVFRAGGVWVQLRFLMHPSRGDMEANAFWAAVGMSASSLCYAADGSWLTLVDSADFELYRSHALGPAVDMVLLTTDKELASVPAENVLLALKLNGSGPVDPGVFGDVVRAVGAAEVGQ